ncbi:glycosyltransferase [Dyadobacter sp. CY345]|uniref:glycosyltransferase family 2 protein n=1 Tax=Dyadobacter sp. CY345 TaxID=2909335 RepID=UPI001F294861|nr:glycosyltransferase family 2 protein [Dyadobacter sp. CY345]MCF2442770.1 glycosyltransferase [Dyadobacter sp. CY345]
MVSIIMPCYNSQKYISASIESVLAQTMAEWELIIVNDASTDGTEEIIDHYSERDSRIKVFHLKKNSSAAGARNIGIDNAKYSHIAFLDSDDLWLPEKLRKQVSTMEEKNMMFSFSSYYVINNDGKVMEFRKAPNFITYEKLLNHGNEIGCLTVMYNREMFKNYRFNEKIRIHEDYKMWLDMFENIDRAYAIEEPLAFYRVHAGSKNLNKIRSFKWNWLLWRTYQKQSILSSLMISFRWISNKIFQKLTAKNFNTSNNSPLTYPSVDQKSVY